MATTSIEWTRGDDGVPGMVWNPTTGCDRVSLGCDHCYALTMAKRLKGMGSPKYQRDGDPRTSGPGFGITEHADALDAPRRWTKPRRVFVNSMSDLFHDGISDEFIARVFAVMALCPQHTFQVLTKRHGRMRSLLSNVNFAHLVAEQGRAHHIGCQQDWLAVGAMLGREPLPNVWLGVSTENQYWADIRIPALLDTPAAVRWISAEPLLDDIDLRLTHDTGEPAEHHGIDWVVTGGESGPNARAASAHWFRSIRDQCAEAGVPYLHKQNGGRTPKANGRELDGRTHDEFPEVRPCPA